MASELQQTPFVKQLGSSGMLCVVVSFMLFWCLYGVIGMVVAGGGLVWV